MNKCLNCNKETTNPKYCTRSCAVTVNNKIYKKRKKQGRTHCVFCNGKLTGASVKYCNTRCHQDHRWQRTEQLIESGDTSLYFKNYRKYLIKKHGASCMECGWDRINPVTGNCPIEMDHIDGDPDNNELSNLRIVCPNCHSLKPTYKALNKGNGRHYRIERRNKGLSF
jgi:hypothetical protein